MSAFTTSLSDELLNELDQRASALKLPKNKLIEKALRLYLDHLNRADYIKSYKRMNDDKDILLMAEEGMADYLSNLEEA